MTNEQKKAITILTKLLENYYIEQEEFFTLLGFVMQEQKVEYVPYTPYPTYPTYPQPLEPYYLYQTWCSNSVTTNKNDQERNA